MNVLVANTFFSLFGNKKFGSTNLLPCRILSKLIESGRIKLEKIPSFKGFFRFRLKNRVRTM